MRRAVKHGAILTNETLPCLFVAGSTGSGEVEVGLMRGWRIRAHAGIVP